ncbi:methyltransferase family protein [Afifella marina]|uniref:methyltransferase family protein n=1 Tax=Afifella marina TaxID=1080 RepID=UPI001FCD3C09|nr:isoprenylcysteine carboxylmethyltransferase family protein [Afifella marina]
MENDSNQQTAPSSIPWPPIIVAGSVLVGLLLAYIAPLPWPDADGALRGLGGLIVLAALGIDLWGYRTFRPHQTTLRPDRAASALVTAGPFRYSRNPFYVGNVMLVVGLGLAFANWWLVLLGPVALVLMDRLAARPEEKHLEDAFGAEYLAYKARVGRWL